MIVDARSLPRNTVVDADVCIVGAGAAGITLAREFAKTNPAAIGSEMKPRWAPALLGEPSGASSKVDLALELTVAMWR